MKCGLVIIEDMVQVMLSPENEHEENVLEIFSNDYELSLIEEQGTFYNDCDVVGYNVTPCRGGYIRAFSKKKAVMIVLVPKEEKSVQT